MNEKSKISRRDMCIAAFAMAIATIGVRGQTSGQRGDAVHSHLDAPVVLLCQGKPDPLAVAEAHPRLSWQLRAAAENLHAVRQSAYQIEVAASREDLVTDRALVWNSGKTPSAPEVVSAAAFAGQPLEASRTYWWRVRAWDEDGRASRWSQPAHWTQAPVWRARWIAAHATDAEAGTLPLPLLRKEFSLHGRVTLAVLHIAGLGQYEVHINGAKVGNAELTPGWSDYRKTVFYDSYNVTQMLRRGENALGVLLGNGMYRVQSTKGRYTKFEGSYGPPKCIAQIHIELADGQKLDIATDATWKTAPGPITFSSIYGGEDYDARREIAGWDLPGLKDERWSPAVAVDGPGGAMTPEEAPPIRVLHRYLPVHASTPRAGVTVYDLVQNFAGWAGIQVAGQAGATIRLICGELLDHDGTVSQRSSGAPQWFQYTLKGKGVEVWHPRFSYYGFRYVQLETTGRIDSFRIEGKAVHSSSAIAGEFRTSNDLLNRIHSLILRAIENNAQSLLTDCPHREKLGWLEETHLMAPSILYDFDFSGIYSALARNLADVQNTGGAQPGLIPEIAPQYVVFEPHWGRFNDSPEWGSAAVLAPWYLYQRTGNLEALLAQREVMRRYVDYLGTRATNGIVAYGLGDWLDTGQGKPGGTSLTTIGVTATAIYYQDLRTVERVNALAGDDAASRHYGAIADGVRDAFNRRFFDPAHHRYDMGSQTAQAMPLAIGMVPEAERGAVLDALVADIHAHGDHVTAGDVGYHYVVDALLDGGRSDVLLAMLERNDAPSYGYQLAVGATALAEAWDANPTSSQDHFMLGHAEEWFYRGLGGISIDHSSESPGRLVFQPQMVGDLNWVRSYYDSTWGRVESNWIRTKNGTEYEFSVPVNATATIRIRSRTPVWVNGVQPNRAEGVMKYSNTGTSIEIVVGSGRYKVTEGHNTAPYKR
ncbi:MAG: family 78 glycoside hydrolase catalytic domain [Terracidiphilus sp.]